MQSPTAGIGLDAGKELPALDYYSRLHLYNDHEAAQIGGLSVQAAHIESLAQFIRMSELYGLDPPQTVEGILRIAGWQTGGLNWPTLRRI